MTPEHIAPDRSTYRAPGVLRYHQAAQGRSGVGGRTGRDSRLLQPLLDKVIDGVALPRIRHRHICDRLEGPVTLVGGTLFDPAADERNLASTEYDLTLSFRS